LPVILDN